MTDTQQIIWTALPNGIISGGTGPALRVSVILSPRLLGPDSTLQNYDFRHWPKSLSGVSFSLTFTDPASSFSETLHAQRDPESPTAEEGLWDQMFSDSTYVRAYVFDDYRNNFILSPRLNNVHSFIQNAYQQIGANSPDQLSNLKTLQSIVDPQPPGAANTPGALSGTPEQYLGRTILSLKSKYANQSTIPPVVPVLPGGTGTPTTAEDFLSLRTFHYRPANYSSTVPPPGQAQQIDFHQAVSSLTKYSELLRRLGLVIDLLVPFDPRIPQNSSTLSVQVNPSFSSTLTSNTNIRPQTFCTLTNSSFVPTPKTQEVQNGMLNLGYIRPDIGVPAFNLMQIDVDGSALKLVGFANSIGSMLSPTTGSAFTPQEAGLPALRSAGLFISKTGRATDLVQTFNNSAVNNTAAGGGGSPSLYAEDLVRGYRVDVFDQSTGKWYSLCRRKGTYYIGTTPTSTNPSPTPALVSEDEAFVSLAIAQDPSTPPIAGSSPPLLYLHEALFRWDGWSLAAPAPGNVVDSSGAVSTPNNAASTGFPFEADFVAKERSLPRLRFGRSYRMRARTVDLAGNSLPYTSTDATYATPPTTSSAFPYLRFEPVAAPAVVLHDDLSTIPGESVLRLVVRSDVGVDSATYVNTLNALLTKLGRSAAFVADSQRHIAPPKTAQLMAEHHGMFDVSGPVVMDVNAYGNLQGTNEGFASASLDGSLDGSGQTDPTVYNTNQLILPYLPDPIVRGASFLGLPSTPTPANGVQQPYSFVSGRTWPFVQPFRLLLHGVLNGTTPAAPAYSGGVLTAQLAQGDMVNVQLSSFFNPTDLRLMGIWSWLKNVIPAGSLTTVQSQALRGLLPMLTPFQEISLVHAVQHPLITPAFDSSLAATKQSVGQTYAVLQQIPMTISGKSTAKVDIQATWTEPLDTTGGALQTIDGSAHVVEIPVQETDTSETFDLTAGAQRRHEFHDTKHRFVNYTATASTRFKEYFPITDQDIATGAGGVTPDFYTVTGPVASVHVPNSARPDPPKLLYVIPAFQWSTTTSSGSIATNRLGGRLRVYLDRPWYSSGDNELLGVVVLTAGAPAALRTRAERVSKRAERTERARPVRGRDVFRRLSRLYQTASTGVPVELQPYVTQWGSDPLWDSASSYLHNTPSTGNFPLALPPPLSPWRQTSFSIAEVPNYLLNVAGHAVTLDQTSNRWYSDIEVQFPTVYYPFIRLALARYQPYSIDDAHLSHIVLADFAQLTPDRSASITYTPGSKNVNVQVSGVDYQVNASNATVVLGPGGKIEVTVEQQQPGVSGELAWVPVPNAVYPLAASDVSTGSPQAVWQGTITLPANQGSEPFRLVIREYEGFSAENDAGGNFSTRRLVYAASVDI